MFPQAGQTLELLDARQRQIGKVVVEESTEDLISGTFQPGPDYPAVECLVREFEEAANDQALAEGLRLLSAYRLKSNVSVWVITEADRSATTLLLPDEY